KVDGIEIFPKLPVQLREYYNAYERNTRIKAAMKKTKRTQDLLKKYVASHVPVERIAAQAVAENQEESVEQSSSTASEAAMVQQLAAASALQAPAGPVEAPQPIGDAARRDPSAGCIAVDGEPIGAIQGLGPELSMRQDDGKRKKDKKPRAKKSCKVCKYHGRPLQERIKCIGKTQRVYSYLYKVCSHCRKRHLSSASARFPHLQQPTAQDAKELLARLNHRPGSVLTSFNINTATDCLDKYNVDWTSQYRGESSIVVRPQSTDEVVQIVDYCNTRRLGIVPQGGNTGLVGGSVPIAQEIVLSLEKMNQIYTTPKDDSTNILRADAGCILQDLQEFAAVDMDCLVPVDLGAKGTCQIGGNLSTNAGGVYYYRYGSLHANCLGLEVVVPKGDGGGHAKVLNLSYYPASHLKDNTGYDLKQLFIGAEGTLGIVTKVALLCPPRPTSIGAVWLTCESLHNVLQILKLAKTNYLTEILAAFEFMDHDVLDMVEETHRSAVTLPVAKQSYSVLIETHGSNEEHDQDKLSTFLEAIMDQGFVVDGVVARNLGQVDEFWKIRDICNPAAAASGFVYKYDVSLAAIDFEDFIHEIKTQLESFHRNDLRCVNWGHIIGKFHPVCFIRLSFVFLHRLNIDPLFQTATSIAILCRREILKEIPI
ncbi:MAG: hypothetical protein SGILL_008460, partial [Bacillariaceae sp.]